jgi:hypothetical protein
MSTLKLQHGRHLQHGLTASQLLGAIHLQRLTQRVGLCNVGCDLGLVLLGYGCYKLLFEAVCLPPAEQVLVERSFSCNLCCSVCLQQQQ